MAFDILTQQALITGSVVDAISGAVPRQPLVLNVLRDSDGKPLQSLTARMAASGIFVIQTDPSRTPSPQDIDLRLEISATGYEPLSHVVNFSVAELTRADDAISVNGTAITAQVISGAPKSLTLEISPQPVWLRGRVSQAEDGSQPIEGATVQVTGPEVVGPVSTNPEGYFTLGPLPVAESIDLMIAAAGREPFVGPFRPDFRQPTNLGAFALEPS